MKISQPAENQEMSFKNDIQSENRLETQADSISFLIPAQHWHNIPILIKTWCTPKSNGHLTSQLKGRPNL